MEDETTDTRLKTALTRLEPAEDGVQLEERNFLLWNGYVIQRREDGYAVCRLDLADVGAPYTTYDTVDDAVDAVSDEEVPMVEFEPLYRPEMELTYERSVSVDAIGDRSVDVQALKDWLAERCVGLPDGKHALTYEHEDEQDLPVRVTIVTTSGHRSVD